LGAAPEGDCAIYQRHQRGRQFVLRTVPLTASTRAKTKGKEKEKSKSTSFFFNWEGNGGWKTDGSESTEKSNDTLATPQKREGEVFGYGGLSGPEP